jgi:hypothetical protein
LSVDTSVIIEEGVVSDETYRIKVLATNIYGESVPSEYLLIVASTELPENNCTSTVVDQAQKQYGFTIPESGSEKVSFPDASTDYVEDPLDGCTQEFDFLMTDGSEKPAELKIDAETGIFELDLYSNLSAAY